MGTIGPKSEYYRKAAASVIKALKARGFEGYYAADRDEARELATGRMTEEAARLGADAVVNIRYATSAIMQGAAEVMAYGTAVKYV